MAPSSRTTFAAQPLASACPTGIGLPDKLVSVDLKGVTYCSIRAGLIEFRRRAEQLQHNVEQLQHNVVVHLFCPPVWDRFVRLAVLSGDLPARDFDRAPVSYLACKWLPPKFDYVGSQEGRRGQNTRHQRRFQKPPSGNFQAGLQR